MYIYHFFYFFSWRIAPSYITQRVVSSRSCQLYEGTTPPFLMVGMRTGPGCVKIRSGGCGEGVRVSSKLSRLYAPDLMCGVRETQVRYCRRCYKEILDCVELKI